MKYIALICVLLNSSYALVSQTFFDNFETYKIGSPLCLQSEGEWTTSDGTPGGDQDVIVTDEQSFSGNKSIMFTNTSTSVLLPFNVNTGKWELSFKMRIDSGYTGSFRITHRPIDDETNTAFQVNFTETGDGLFNAAYMVILDFSHPVAEWFDVRLEVNTDNNRAYLFFNEIPVLWPSAWAWCLGDLALDTALTALQFSHYPENEGKIKYFIDDVGFQQTNLKLDDTEMVMRVHPNPTRNKLLVDASGTNASSCDVYSIIGSHILKKAVHSDKIELDCSKWDPGIYFIHLHGDKKSWQSKFVVE